MIIKFQWYCDAHNFPLIDDTHIIYISPWINNTRRYDDIDCTITHNTKIYVGKQFEIYDLR